MHPLRADLHALVTHALLWLLDRGNRAQMRAGSNRRHGDPLLTFSPMWETYHAWAPSAARSSRVRRNGETIRRSNRPQQVPHIPTGFLAALGTRTPPSSQERAEAGHRAGDERALARRELGEPGVEDCLRCRDRGSESPLAGPREPEPEPAAIVRGGEPYHEPPTCEPVDEGGRAGQREPHQPGAAVCRRVRRLLPVRAVVGSPGPEARCLRLGNHRPGGDRSDRSRRLWPDGRPRLARASPVACRRREPHAPSPRALPVLKRHTGQGRRYAQRGRHRSRPQGGVTRADEEKAQALYRSSGYREVKPFNDEPYAH